MTRLLHPLPVYVQQIDRSGTPKFDANLAEPIGQVERWHKPIRLLGQVKLDDLDDPTASPGGIIEESSPRSYIAFLTKDLHRVGITLQRGDRIIQIGDAPNATEVDYYITHFRHLAHYHQAKGNTLIRAYFRDRHPSRQRGDL